MLFTIINLDDIEKCNKTPFKNKRSYGDNAYLVI